MTVLLVDWLGRGGIAQDTESWAIEVARAGAEVVVVTRGERELAEATVPVRVSPPARTRVGGHRRLVRTVVEAIHELRPSSIVLQNFLIAPLEEPVHRAARSVGARLIQVVHDHQHHTRTSGMRAGLAHQLRRADVVVAHTDFVRRSIGQDLDRPVQVFPLPVPLGLVPEPRPPAAPPKDGPRVAVHLGVLTRADNKGTDVVVELAERGVAGWQLAFAGVGAPSPAGAISHNRFLAAGELVAVVEASTSTLLPYRFASQSGVIVLAQALGSVPIATRVGGLPEQIEDGVTGLLLPQGAGADELAEALRRLDGPEATAMAAKGQATAWDRHADFARAVRGLL